MYRAMERNKIYIMGIPEEKEKEKGIESIFKVIIAENIPKLETETSRSKRPEEPQIGEN